MRAGGFFELSIELLPPRLFPNPHSAASDKSDNKIKKIPRFFIHSSMMREAIGRSVGFGGVDKWRICIHDFFQHRCYIGQIKAGRESNPRNQTSTVFCLKYRHLGIVFKKNTRTSWAVSYTIPPSSINFFYKKIIRVCQNSAVCMYDRFGSGFL